MELLINSLFFNQRILFKLQLNIIKYKYKLVALYVNVVISKIEIKMDTISRLILSVL